MNHPKCLEDERKFKKRGTVSLSPGVSEDEGKLKKISIYITWSIWKMKES
jgi:hypothetical protein